MTAVAKLLSCPFCGRSNLIISRMHGTGDRYVVCQTPECKTCGPSGDAREDAIAAWNRRAALSPTELGGVEGPLSYRLSMVSGVSGSLWVIGDFNDKTTAEVCAKNLLELDAKNHPEWSGRQIDVIRTTPRAAEAVTDEMVERALDAYYCHGVNWREASQLSSLEELMADMRAALFAALTPPSAKGE